MKTHPLPKTDGLALSFGVEDEEACIRLPVTR